MPYLGTPPQSGFITSDAEKITGQTTNYVNLSNAISSLDDVQVHVNYVIQDPSTLTLNSTTQIGLGDTLVSSDVVLITYLGKAVATQTPAVGTVTNDMLAGSITAGKLSSTAVDNTNTNSTLITAQTEKSSLVDADKFLISDSAASGALKYVQKSNLGGGSLEYIQGSTSTSNATLLAQDGFVDDSKYAYYKIWFYSRRTNEAQTITARFRASGSELTVNNYRSHVSSHTSAGEADNSYVNTYATIETDMSTRSAIWEFDMMPHIGINNNSSYLVGRGFNYKYNSDVQQQRLTVGGFLYNENVDVDGIQFEVSGGFARHELRIYGVKP